jgi:hypothetical protein
MKIRVPGAYVYFALGVILVTALTFIEVPCPTDGGTGVITGARGVEITGVEAELVEHKIIDMCYELWDEFTYAVKISVVNETTTTSYGGIVVTFHDPRTATPGYFVDTLDPITDDIISVWVPGFPGAPWKKFLRFITVAAETTKTIELTLVAEGESFGESHGVWTRNISADMAEEFACPYCGGTGKVPITEWLRIKVKD